MKGHPATIQNAIDSVLQQPSAQAIIREDLDGILWKSVDGSLVECWKTLESMEKLVVDLRSRETGIRLTR